MNAFIYIEGGGDSKELHTRCREAFRRLLERCGFSGRMPRLVACGGRSAVYSDFKTAHGSTSPGTYVAMLLDSEDPIADVEKTWAHLASRDNWTQPPGAGDDQVLLMTTCMETWIVADRPTLREHYGSDLQESVLPALTDMESRGRNDIQDALARATQDCKNAYAKGKRSFVVLGKLNPKTLDTTLLPSFQRFRRILQSKLPPTQGATTRRQ